MMKTATYVTEVNCFLYNSGWGSKKMFVKEITAQPSAWYIKLAESEYLLQFYLNS